MRRIANYPDQRFTLRNGIQVIRQLVALDVFRFVGTQASAQDWPTFIISELEKEKVAQRPGAQSQLAGGDLSTLRRVGLGRRPRMSHLLMN
jgi:hypothetical protein